MANGSTDASTGSTRESRPGTPHSPVRALIRQIPFLSNFSSTEVVDVLANSTEFSRFRAGDVLIAQDAEASHIYYLLEGKVRLVRTRADAEGRPVPLIERSIGPGTLLGRFALIYNLPYTSQVQAETDVLALRFRMSALERLLFRFPEIRAQIIPQLIINRLRTIPLLKDVELITLSYLAEEVKVEHVDPKQLVYTHDQQANKLYLINKGQVELYHPRQAEERYWLGTGGAFGFPGSVGGVSVGTDQYGHWAHTTAPTTFYTLPWESINRVAKRFPSTVDAQLQFLPYETIRQVSVFENYTEEIKRKLAGFCSFQHIPQHHMVLQQGDIGDSMWILLAGGKAIISALDKDDRALPRMPVDGIVYFHETALRAARNVRSTVETEPGSTWLRLHWQDFRRFLDEEGESLLYDLKIQLPEDETMRGQENPQHYAWLGQGELLVSLNHRHWIALIGKLKLTAVIILASLILIVVVASLAPGLLGWAVGLAGLICVPLLLWGIIDYLNDYFIITNQRIIQQEKVILTTEYRREALLEQIERVDVQASFWGNLLKYGTLKIFTAGTVGFIEFDLVPEPDALKTLIFHERSLRHLRYRAESRVEIQNALERRLGIVMELPTRVRSTNVDLKATVDKLTPWQRFWRSIRRRELKMEMTDRIIWRKHWIMLLQSVATPLTLLILLVGIMISALISASLGWFGEIQSFILGLELLLIVPFLGLTLWLIYEILDWWNDTYEISKDRIIDIEKLPFFLKELRREAELSQIQDVTYRISSPVEMLLNYGNVIVQTAATQGAFTFLHVPDPRGVKEEINRRVIEWRRQNELQKVRDQAKELPDWFDLYNRLEAGQEPSRLLGQDEA